MYRDPAWFMQEALTFEMDLETFGRFLRVQKHTAAMAWRNKGKPTPVYRNKLERERPQKYIWWTPYPWF
jgi:hypothetical protein